MKNRTLNVPRLIMIITVLTLGAVAGSYFAALHEDAVRFTVFGLSGARAAFKMSFLCDAVLLLLLLLSAVAPSGGLIRALVLAAKGFLLAVCAGVLWKGGLSPLAVLPFAGGFLSSAACVVMALCGGEYSGLRGKNKSEVAEALVLTGVISVIVSLLSAALLALAYSLIK